MSNNQGGECTACKHRVRRECRRFPPVVVWLARYFDDGQYTPPEFDFSG